MLIFLIQTDKLRNTKFDKLGRNFDYYESVKNIMNTKSDLGEFPESFNVDQFI